MSLQRVGQLDITNAHLKWVLDTRKFHSCKNNESIDSPTFFVNNKIQKLYIRFYPKGVSKDDNMAIYLFNDNDYEITLNFSFSLLTNYDNKFKITQSMYDRTIPSKCKLGWSDYVLKSVVYDPVSKIIKDGKLTIVCSITGQMIIADHKKNRNKLLELNAQLFTNQMYSDITIKTNEKEFNLHKVILATRSSVFEAMFNTDMMEREKNIVEINDIDPDVLYQFFQYLYTNKVENFKELAQDLLVVADEYLVSDLKDECEEIMTYNINIDNAIEYLKFSELHSLKILKSEVFKFMASNITTLNDKPEFKSLSQEYLLEIINEHVNLVKIKN